jgi:hypothetical protein
VESRFLLAEVTGEVEKNEGVLVIRRVHVAMRSTAPEDVREAVPSGRRNRLWCVLLGYSKSISLAGHLIRASTDRFVHKAGRADVCAPARPFHKRRRISCGSENT